MKGFYRRLRHPLGITGRIQRSRRRFLRAAGSCSSGGARTADLHHLPVRKPEDVHARKLGPLAGGFSATPRPRVRARGSPAPRYQIAFGQDQIDIPSQVRKGCSEVGRDLALPFGTRKGFGRAEVMADVVLGEDLEGEVHVALVPDFFIELKHGSLVLFG
jgi:hypothetical protein